MDKKTVLKGVVKGVAYTSSCAIGGYLGYDLGNKIVNRIEKYMKVNVNCDKSIKADLDEIYSISMKFKNRWLTKKQKAELTLKLKAVNKRMKAKMGKHYWKALGHTVADVDTWIDTFCTMSLSVSFSRAIGYTASKLINKIDKMPSKSKSSSSSDTKKKTPPAKGKGGKK